MVSVQPNGNRYEKSFRITGRVHLWPQLHGFKKSFLIQIVRCLFVPRQFVAKTVNGLAMQLYELDQLFFTQETSSS
jgi:hypothetical protein